MSKFITILFWVTIYTLSSNALAQFNPNELEKLIDSLRQSPQGRALKIPTNNFNYLREYYYYSNPREGIQLFNTLSSQPQVVQNEQIKSRLYSGIAYLYKALELYEISAKYYYQAIHYAEKNNDISFLGWLHIDFGNLLYANQDYQNAINFYRSAEMYLKTSLKTKNLDQNERKDLELGIAVASENIGLCYQSMKLYDSAFYYVTRTKEYRLRPTLSKMFHQYYYKTLAKIYLDAGHPDSAIYYSKISYDFDKDKYVPKEDLPAYFRFLADAKATIGLAYLVQQKKDSANKYLDDAIETVKLLNNDLSTIDLYGIIANFLIEKGFTQNSEKFSNEAINIISRNPELKPKLIVFYKILAEVFAKRGQFEKAKKLQDEILAINDTIVKNTKSQIIQYAKLDVDLQEKAKELEILNIEKSYKEKQLQNQRIILLLVLSIAIVLAVLIGVVYSNYKKKQQMAKKLEESNNQLIELNAKLKNALILTEALNRELEKSQKELLASNAELDLANRTKNTLFSIIAHDLKNSIGSLKNSIALLLDENFSFTLAERKEILKVLKEGAESTYQMLENLLLWSFAQANKIRPTFKESKPYYILNSVINNLSEIAKKKKIIIENKIPMELTYQLDETLLEIILQNLVHNSIKYSNENGAVQVSCSVNEDGLFFCVADNGVGIPAEKAEKLLKTIRSETTVGTKGERGTGLGLSIVKDLISLHNGKIWFESEEGKGTKFYFTLGQIQDRKTKENSTLSEN